MCIQVSQYQDPYEACLAVAAESHRRWLQHEMRTDDISIVVAQLSNVPATPPPLILRPAPVGCA